MRVAMHSYILLAFFFVVSCSLLVTASHPPLKTME